MSVSYKICDEPTPGLLSKFAVNPLWPLLGIVTGGIWLSWPWFVFNALALGCPNLRKTIVWVCVGLLGATSIVAVLLYLDRIEVITNKIQVQYGLLVLDIFRVAVTYRLLVLQSQTIELYEYFGGELRNGLPVLLAAFAIKYFFDYFTALPHLVYYVLM